MLTDPQQPFRSPQTQGLLPFYTPLSYHYPVVPPAHDSTGVFHNTSLTQIIGISRYINWHPFTAFPFCISFSHIFHNTSLPKNVPLFCLWTEAFDNSFFLHCLLVHLHFAKPMPIISARGIKRPCYLSERLFCFYEGRGNRKDWTTIDLQPFVPAQISLQLLPLQFFEVVVVRRENY